MKQRTNKKKQSRKKWNARKIKFEDFCRRNIFPYTLYSYIKHKSLYMKQAKKVLKILEENDQLTTDLLEAGFYIPEGKEKYAILDNMQFFKLNTDYMDNIHPKQVADNVNFNLNRLLNVDHAKSGLAQEMHLDRATDNVNYYRVTLTPHKIIDVQYDLANLKSAGIKFGIFAVISAAVYMTLSFL